MAGHENEKKHPPELDHKPNNYNLDNESMRIRLNNNQSTTNKNRNIIKYTNLEI